ncbi:MAG: hypothetical protein HYS17_09640 [Micavibrio aeruginosavorus]|uniref:Uncharacterized protein n=1 Tax=Micavibrio aeruginosavorus TaxID=349221 RepID=A0A7T5R1H3_9BACT|nr:MAG: hypothetical protein HYS17_09640 [Micavibrio aeruginosavorus]
MLTRILARDIASGGQKGRRRAGNGGKDIGQLSPAIMLKDDLPDFVLRVAY